MSEDARRTREMCGLVERLLAGEATRDELCAWARSASQFRRNWAADGLHTLLYNLDRRRGDEWLVRDGDLREQLAIVRHGAVGLDEGSFATVDRPFEELASRIDHGRRRRFAVEGLGWFEEVRFVSFATGRPFAIGTSLEATGRCGLTTTLHPIDERTIEDVADCLGLVRTDIVWLQSR